MSFASSDLVNLAVAVLGGLAVGIEREWSGHAIGPRARFAGVRTFTLLGLMAGLSGWLWTAGLTGPALVFLAGLGALVVIAYQAARHGRRRCTSMISPFKWKLRPTRPSDRLSLCVPRPLRSPA